METVTSPDGTSIAYFRSGAGPPLVLVHGMIADHTTTWRFVIRELERRFTVYAMDRRGRGKSGDSPEYELRREAEDIAAVVDSIGGPVNVLGHSYGGLCAIEAALITEKIQRLILYESIHPDRTDIYGTDFIERLEAMLELGRIEEMLVTFMRELVQMPSDEIEMLRSQQDAWAVRMRNAPTIPRELREDRQYEFVSERFSGLSIPVLLLVGGDSPPRELKNAGIIAGALPDAKIVTLPEQQHLAMYTAPELFVNAVFTFLDEGD